jgi:tetratricopeptide (TPR) repeat protein
MKIISFSSVKRYVFLVISKPGIVKFFLSFIIVVLINTSFKNPINYERLFILKYESGLNIRNGKYSEAYRNLKKIDRIEPLDFKASIAFAKVCCFLGKYPDAIELLYRTKYSIRTNNSKAHLDAWLGLMYAYNKDFRKSQSSFNLSLHKFKKEKTVSSEMIANLFNNMGCLNLFNSAVECTPPENLHFSFKLADLRESIFYLELAKRYNASDSVILSNLNYLKRFDINNNNQQFVPNCPNCSIITFNLSDTVKKPEPKEVDFSPSSDLMARLVDGINKLVNYLKKYDQIVFIIDYSGYMTTIDNIVVDDIKIQQSRYDIMIYSINRIFKELLPENKIGAISVGNDCYSAPLISYSINDPANKSDILRSIQALDPYGPTPLNRIFQRSGRLFSDQKKDKKAIVLLSDGVNTCGGSEFDICSLSKRFTNQGIDIFVLSYLLENNENFLAYAVYNCVSNKELFGITNSLELEDKNIDVNTNIYPLLFPERIDTGLCLNRIKRYRFDLCDAQFFIPEYHHDKYKIEF